MNKKLEDILFYASTSIKPPKKGLEYILDNLPVTNQNNYRYNNIMGLKFAIPIGILILAIMVFVGVGKKPSQPQTVTVLPATVTKQNVDSSLKQVDSVLSESEDKVNRDLKELDQEDSQSSKDESNQEDQGDSLNDL